MQQAKFVTGSTLSHVLYMSFTGAVGITTLFLVDLLDMFFLSLLGEEELAAAIGYAGSISFFMTSVGIGLAIAVAALVSRAIGSGDRERAKRLLINISFAAVLVCSLVALLVWLNVDLLLSLLGAEGYTKQLATAYLNILIPSMPILALGMALGAGLRAVGDGKRAMYSTLYAGLINAIFDPVLIFALSMGVEGAAWASVLARIAIVLIAGRAIIFKHQLICRFQFALFFKDCRVIFAIALPAMMTNIATPVGNAFVTRMMAEFGDSVVAGYAVIGRLIPVLFGVVFALSGAIGPIVGQNYGAHKMDRVRQSLKNAISFCVVYVGAVSLLFFLLQQQVIALFALGGRAAELVVFFSNFIALSFVFNGIMFVANASFNNLGKPTYSTLMNWGKATLGTLPFIWLGAKFYGAEGVLLGQALGSLLFSLLGIYCAFALIGKQAYQVQQDQKKTDERGAEDQAIDLECAELNCEFSPLSSGNSQLSQLADKPG